MSPGQHVLRTASDVAAQLPMPTRSLSKRQQDLGCPSADKNRAGHFRLLHRLHGVGASLRKTSGEVLSNVPLAHSLALTLSQLASPHLRSEERREGKSVDLGGRRIIKKKKKRAARSASSD